MRRIRGPRWGGLLALAAALPLAACGRDLDRPVPVPWDKVACDHCGMLVGEPRHAAELVTRSGDVEFFDDPGCLFRYEAERSPAVAHLWFRGGEGEDAWLSGRGVAFATGATTPMGSGLVAVPAGTPGALSLPDARARALSGGRP